MDLDAMAIHVRKLKEFRDKWEPFLVELAKQKAAHAERPERLMGKPKSSDDDPRGDAIETGGTGVDGPPGE